MTPERLVEFSVYLDQRPGEFAGLLDAASAAGVDVRAVAVGEHNGKGLVRLVGEPTESLRRVCETLADAGVGPIIEGEVFAVSVENRPGAMRELVTAMADRRINLRYAYMMPRRGQEPSKCVFRVDEDEELASKLASIDWPEG